MRRVDFPVAYLLVGIVCLTSAISPLGAESVPTSYLKKVDFNVEPGSAMGAVYAQLTKGNAQYKLCTFTLISKEHAVTDAHCLVDDDPYEEVTLVFRYTYPKPGETRPSATATVKAKPIAKGNYKSSSDVAEDWAILKLSEPLGDKYGWIELSPTGPKVGDLVTASGYAHEKGKVEHPRQHRNCEVSATEKGVVRAYCAANEGSSGGPVTIRLGDKTLLVGIISAGGNPYTFTVASTFIVSSERFFSEIERIIPAKSLTDKPKGNPQPIWDDSPYLPNSKSFAGSGGNENPPSRVADNHPTQPAPSSNGYSDEIKKRLKQYEK